jgi:heme exporter protein A
MLDATALACQRGHRRLFSDLSFSLHPGDCIEVRGPNGSGKSSLLRTVCGLLPPTRGIICWHGDPIDAVSEGYRSSVTYIGHREALTRVGLGEQADLLAQHLSEGQRRRLSLTRLASCHGPLWVLDEVLTAMDVTAVDPEPNNPRAGETGQGQDEPRGRTAYDVRALRTTHVDWDRAVRRFACTVRVDGRTSRLDLAQLLQSARAVAEAFNRHVQFV